MKIVINMVSPAHGGGFHTYNYNILKGLLNKTDKNEYYIFINDESIDSYSIPDAKNIHLITVSSIFSKTIPRYFWMQIILPINLIFKNVDVLFSPMNIMPIILKLSNVKSILVVHTNLPWLYPEVLEGISRLRLFFLKIFIKLSIFASHKIIVDSQTAKKELIRIFPSIINKTKTIYLGVDKNRFGNTTTTFSLNGRINIKKDNYFLTISSSVRYHCLIELISAYDNLNSQIKDLPKFLLISKNIDYEYFREINEFISTRNFSEKIILIENLDSDLLPTIYHNAELYIFSSYCEVFGFTNLEAMSCGVPVLTAGKSALPEICGEAAIYFDPHDSDDIASKISYLYFNEELKKEMITRGYNQASKYSWNNTCAQTESLILNDK